MGCHTVQPYYINLTFSYSQNYLDIKSGFNLQYHSISIIILPDRRLMKTIIEKSKKFLLSIWKELKDLKTLALFFVVVLFIYSPVCG